MVFILYLTSWSLRAPLMCKKKLMFLSTGWRVQYPGVCLTCLHFGVWARTLHGDGTQSLDTEDELGSFLDQPSAPSCPWTWRILLKWDFCFPPDISLPSVVTSGPESLCFDFCSLSISLSSLFFFLSLPPLFPTPPWNTTGLSAVAPYRPANAGTWVHRGCGIHGHLPGGLVWGQCISTDSTAQDSEWVRGHIRARQTTPPSHYFCSALRWGGCEGTESICWAATAEQMPACDVKP